MKSERERSTKRRANTCPLQEVNAETWLKFPKDKRTEVLEMVEEAEVKLGPAMKQTLIRTYANEIDTDNIDELLETVLPALAGAGTSEFNMWKPRLRDAGLPEMQMCTLMLRLLIHERLVPAMSGAEANSSSLLALSVALRKAMDPSLARAAGAVLEASVKEVYDISGYFIALLSPEPGAHGTSIASVDELKHGAGTKALVRSKVAQVKFWKSLEGRYRTAVVAEKSDGPVIQKALEGMKGGDASAVKLVIEKLPVWRDRLRSITVGPVEAALEGYFKATLATFKSGVMKKAVTPEHEMLAKNYIELARLAHGNLDVGCKKGVKFFQSCADEATALAQAMRDLLAAKSVDDAVKALDAEDPDPHVSFWKAVAEHANIPLQETSLQGLFLFAGILGLLAQIC